ncbi:MAG TPA: esterase, partial [Alphaproteobacteria bacterium]|nr:esterase [Alphaproteobacteria bacterium]
DLPVTDLPDLDPKDKTRVYLQQYKGDAAEVRLYTVKGGGHTWPGARDTLLRLVVSTTSQDINATQTIWDFFKDKRRD